MPREGNVVDIRFPVHISGELDGSVYARTVTLPEENVDQSLGPVKGPAPVPLRNVSLTLYNAKGEVEQTSETDGGGFYYFPQIPPGRYLLIIDEESAHDGHFVRPEPQRIEIGYDGTIIYGNNIYVETGGGDIPSTFVSDLKDYKAQHPHVDFSEAEHDLVLNLGEYNSRLLMSVVWYKIQSRYPEIVRGGEIYVPPTESFANSRTGKHILRVGIDDTELSDAYDRCRALMARKQDCKVEIYPSYIKHQLADSGDRAYSTE